MVVVCAILESKLISNQHPAAFSKPVFFVSQRERKKGEKESQRDKVAWCWCW